MYLKSLVVSLPRFTTNFTTNSPQQLAPPCPKKPAKTRILQIPEIPCKIGHFGTIQGEIK